jgi:alpha-mannosidase
MDGKPAQNVRLNFAGPIVAAREINGQEQPVGPATIDGGALVTSFSPYQPRTFAVKLASANAKAPPTQAYPLLLNYEMSVASRPNRPADGSFDWAPNSQGASQGRALPAELLPPDSVIRFGRIPFILGATNSGSPNAILAHGQTIGFPARKLNRVYLLAAAANGDQKGAFRVGDKAVDLTIQDWTGFVGQWDDRIWKVTEEQIAPPANSPPGTRSRTRINPYGEMLEIRPGFIKRADIAWFASHRHATDGSNEAYAYSYLFAYAIDLPAGARTLVLPDNERIRILAITVADEPAMIRPAQPLYDTLEH